MISGKQPHISLTTEIQSHNSLVDFPSTQNVLLSGGADGADYTWAKYANEQNHTIVHWSFETHKSKCPPSHIVKLSQEQLNVADEWLRRANKSLKRKFPTRDLYTTNLLRRNYYQVRWSDSVYAVSSFENNIVSGGTSWAVQMYMDRFIYGQDYMENCKLFVFDQNQKQWFSWQGKWISIDKPPKPEGVYAGIGTRKLSETGIQAIKDVFF